MGADAQRLERAEQYSPATTKNPAGAAGAARHYRPALRLLRRISLQIPAGARGAGRQVRRRAAAVCRGVDQYLAARTHLVLGGFRRALSTASARARPGDQGPVLLPGKGLDRAGK